MTKLLEEACSAVSGLPEEDQNRIAGLIMEELISERRWAEEFSTSQEQLSKLADEALQEFKKGSTKVWDL